YACRVLVQLALARSRPELPHIEDLAAAEAIPANYLVQILNDLRSGGLIVSRRGKQGGYALSRAPAEITLFDVVRAIDGGVLEIRATPGGQSGTRVGAVWSEVARALEEKTRSITLESLTGPEGKPMYYICRDFRAARKSWG